MLPENTIVAGSRSSGRGANSSASTPFGMTSTLSPRMCSRSRSDTTTTRSNRPATSRSKPRTLRSSSFQRRRLGPCSFSALRSARNCIESHQVEDSWRRKPIDERDDAVEVRVHHVERHARDECLELLSELARAEVKDLERELGERGPGRNVHDRAPAREHDCVDRRAESRELASAVQLGLVLSEREQRDVVPLAEQAQAVEENQLVAFERRIREARRDVEELQRGATVPSKQLRNSSGLVI